MAAVLGLCGLRSLIGSVGGMLASCLGSCIGQMAIGACCSLASAFGCKSNRLSKAVYVVIFLSAAILGLVLRYDGQQALAWVTQISSACSTGACWGFSAAYRVSAGLCGFFTVIAICVALYPPAHLGGWMLKILLYVGMLLTGLFALPQSFINVYADISLYTSWIFMLLQSILIVNMAYHLHDKLSVKMAARDAELDAAGLVPGLLSNCWKIAYVVLGFGLFGASVAGCGVLLHFWGTCQLDQFFIIFTLVMGVVCTLLCLTNCIGKGLLPPAVIFAYCTWICYGAVSNDPTYECNYYLQTNNTKDMTQVIIGVCIAAISVTWGAYSSSNGIRDVLCGPSSSVGTAVTGGTATTNPAAGASAPKMVTKDDEDAAISRIAAGEDVATVQAELEGKEDAAEDAETGAAKDWASSSPKQQKAAESAAPKGSDSAARREADAYAEPHAWLFHLVMALGALYMAMVLTNWGSEGIANSSQPGSNPEVSLNAMWLRIATQWVVLVLFAWTLVAPLVCRNRDFS